MEKIIKIDGRDIKFKSTAATPLKYKAQFKTDFFADLIKLSNMQSEKTNKNEIEMLQSIDFDIFYRIIWILAKTADSSIPPIIEWLDGFDEFPTVDIFPELQELILSSISTKKK